MGADTAITSYGISLAPVNSFNYLVQIITAAYKNWPEVVRNLWKARQKSAKLTRVLGGGGVGTQIFGQIYLVVVELVLF